MDTIPLSKLPIGSSAVIEKMALEGFQRQRLLDLGFTPGTTIKAVRRSPTGDPTAFLIRNTLIALRKDETDRIIVTKIIRGGNELWDGLAKTAVNSRKQG